MRRVLVLCVGLVCLLTSSCSLLRPSCDSPAVLKELRYSLFGVEMGPDEKLRDDVERWLTESISITVFDQKRDDSGRHLACTASVKLPEAIFSNMPFLGLAAAMSEMAGRTLTTGVVHYKVSIDRSLSLPKVLLTPADEKEEAYLNAAKLALQGSVPTKPDAKEPQPPIGETKKSEPTETSAGISFAGGSYHRTSPSDADATITAEGSEWRVEIVSATIATDPERASADCHLRGVGPLAGDTIRAKLDENDELLVVRVTATGVFVEQAPSDGICGQNSDATGDYIKSPS